MTGNKSSAWCPLDFLFDIKVIFVKECLTVVRKKVRNKTKYHFLIQEQARNSIGKKYIKFIQCSVLVFNYFLR